MPHSTRANGSTANADDASLTEADVRKHLQILRLVQMDLGRGQDLSCCLRTVASLPALLPRCGSEVTTASDGEMSVKRRWGGTYSYENLTGEAHLDSAG